jgi:hypothetical protein
MMNIEKVTLKFRRWSFDKSLFHAGLVATLENGNELVSNRLFLHGEPLEAFTMLMHSEVMFRALKKWENEHP